ncbi:hypothetical protein [Desulfoluna spongiiphila]|uniref:EF-hand domain-containing protein n=1 Tax=Desulfoluna spongiiphila TaxID=419481 RepID=A0A1G5IFF3_9BACT|nr:hypothetical protein [Desulfoluna spongiiphila]SCY74138.1 hypothetical protein SAMN05216233_11953 [Desulfoluna spongiiphila]
MKSSTHTTLPIAAHRILVVVCALLLMLFAVGCDDDEDNFESQLEEAKIAVDDANYDRAISILTGLEQTPEVLDNLSTAYAGKAGVESFEIFSGVDTGDSDGNDGSIDLFGRMLGSGEQGLLACAEISSRLSLMDQAITALIRSGGSEAGLSTNGKVKLGIYGLTDTVLLLGQILCRNYGDRFTPPGFVGLTEAWVKEARDLIAGDFVTIDITSEELAQINRDVGYVRQAIPALGEGNALGEEFDEFIREIDTSGDGSISFIELIDYLNGLGD